jgi:hypothetical protein
MKNIAATASRWRSNAHNNKVKELLLDGVFGHELLDDVRHSIYFSQPELE